jgi:DNA-binding transcriptional MerR regulator
MSQENKSITDAMFRRNMANIAKKLNEGKTLTKAEIDLIKESEKTLQKTDSEYAEKFKCSVKTIRRAREAGAPLDDVDAMSDWFAASKNSPKGSAEIGGKSAQMAEAKLAKLQKEVERLQIRIDTERKRLIPLEEVRANMVRIASAMRSELLRFAGDVPNWEGLKATEMKSRTDAQVRIMCEQLNDQFSELYTA